MDCFKVDKKIIGFCSVALVVEGLTPGVKVIKLFSSSLTYIQNRRECDRPWQLFHPCLCFQIMRGMRYLTGEDLEVVWAKFSAISLAGRFAVLSNKCMAHIQPLLELKTMPRFRPASLVCPFIRALLQYTTRTMPRFFPGHIRL